MANPRISGAAISTVLGAIILLSITLDAAPSKIPFCLFRNVTSLPCPSCGMTRAFISLGHGHIYNAIVLNPSSIFVYVATLTGFILAVLQILSGKRYILLFWNKIKSILFPVTLAVMALTWIYKIINHFT